MKREYSEAQLKQLRQVAWQSERLTNPRLNAVCEALEECIEVLELSDPAGDDLDMNAPEDAEIDALCRRVGYGAVIDSAARQWRRSDPVGAFTKGACVATVQAAIRQAQDALSAPAAEPEVQP